MVKSPLKNVLLISLGAILLAGGTVATWIFLRAASPFSQTTWVGGGGQNVFTDPSRYSIDNGAIDATTVAGQVQLKTAPFQQDVAFSTLGSGRNVDDVTGDVSMRLQSTAVLPTGNYVFLYNDGTTQELTYKILSPTGTVITPQTLVEPAPVSYGGGYGVAATPTGFAIVSTTWTAASNGQPTGTPNPPATSTTSLRRYNSAGVLQGTPSVVDTQTCATINTAGCRMVITAQFIVSASTSPSGNGDIYVGTLLVTREDLTGSKFYVIGTRWNSAGVQVAGPVSPSTPSAAINGSTAIPGDEPTLVGGSAIAVNDFGQVAYAWMHDDGVNPVTIRLEVRTAADVPVDAGDDDDLVITDVGASSFTVPVISAMKDGNFVVSWSEIPAVGPRHMVYRIISTSETAGTTQNVDSDTSFEMVRSAVDMVTGNIMFVWGSGSSPRVLKGKLLSPSGTDIVPTLQLSPSSLSTMGINISGASIDIGYTNRLLMYMSYNNPSPAAIVSEAIVYILPALMSPGVLTSSVIDTGAPVNWGVLSYTTIPSPLLSGTTAAVRFRCGNTSTPDASWTAWLSIANGADIPSTCGNHRYGQYELTLTSDSQSNPAVSEIRIQYEYVTTTVIPGPPATGKSE